MNRKPTQANAQIVNKLLWEIRSGRYAEFDRLPPEITLSETFGVSRSTMRDALATLEREGFITRKHGVGTLINRHVLTVKTRIDLEEEFLSIIRDAGYVPDIKDSKLDCGPASAFEAEKLKLKPGTEVIRVRRVVSADNTPTIFCIDTFDASLIKNKKYDVGELHKPIFDFLLRYCDEDVFLDLTEIHAENADAEIAEKLNIEKGTALLHLVEVGYNYQGSPILFSSEFYREGVITHTIIRKKIN